jgi:CelD/BcsL family acetyltransferase involved in cellulose biosynthesis
MASIEAEWDQLGAATPFQSPAWLIPSWRHLGRGQLHVVTARMDGRLVGVLPLCSDGDMLRGIGAGVSDYLDWVVAPDCPKEAASKILRSLEMPLSLTNVPASSRLLQDLPSSFSYTASEDCLLAPLPLEPVSKNIRRDIRRSQLHFSPDGPLRILCATAETLPDYLDALFRLHGQRWQSRGSSGVLATENVTAFHREAAPRLLADGRLRMYALLHKSAIIGVIYNLQANGRLCYYISGFDPSFAHYSPGSLLIHHSAKQAAAEGCHTMDFLRGDEDYKRRWGARAVQTFELRSGR